jgi:hypothetical protein
MADTTSPKAQQQAEAQTHELKTWTPYFEAVLNGSKPFELRWDDRRFKVGDHLRLREWNPMGQYTGRECDRTITYVLHADDKILGGLEGGYVILDLAGWEAAKRSAQRSPHDVTDCPHYRRVYDAMLVCNRLERRAHTLMFKPKMEQATTAWRELEVAVGDIRAALLGKEASPEVTRLMNIEQRAKEAMLSGNKVGRYILEGVSEDYGMLGGAGESELR